MRYDFSAYKFFNINQVDKIIKLIKLSLLPHQFLSRFLWICSKFIELSGLIRDLSFDM